MHTAFSKPSSSRRARYVSPCRRGRAAARDVTPDAMRELHNEHFTSDRLRPVMTARPSPSSRAPSSARVRRAVLSCSPFAVPAKAARASSSSGTPKTRSPPAIRLSLQGGIAPSPDALPRHNKVDAIFTSEHAPHQDTAPVLARQRSIAPSSLNADTLRASSPKSRRCPTTPVVLVVGHPTPCRPILTALGVPDKVSIRDDEYAASSSSRPQAGSAGLLEFGY